MQKLDRSERIKRLTGIAIFAACTVALGFISNYITIGIVNITLALIPIVLAACIYGPLAGFCLGALNGLVVLIAPMTSPFLAANPVATVLLCILKTGLAGLAAGWLYRWLKNGNRWLAIILSSLIVPIINTGLFLGACFIFFIPVYAVAAEAQGVEVYQVIITSTLLINFLIEMVVSCVTIPAVKKIIEIIQVKMEAHKVVLPEDENNTDTL